MITWKAMQFQNDVLFVIARACAKDTVVAGTSTDYVF